MGLQWSEQKGQIHEFEQTSQRVDLRVQPGPPNDEPLFLQISRAITGDIQGGRLRPGAPLPGTRTLAESLAVHRNTVIAAYAELSSEGWIESSQARGTFVASSLPTARPRKFTRAASEVRGRPARPGFELRGPAPTFDAELPEGTLVMSGGVPDVRLAPVTELARAYGRVLRTHSPSLLRYSGPHGTTRGYAQRWQRCS